VTYLPVDSVLADRYRIEAEIGRGGYSIVYRARDLTLESPVAIKLLVPPPATEAVARERMRREALVARGLSHPNVVQLHDFVDDEGQTFLVMEFVDGPDLAQHVAEVGPLSPEAAVRTIGDVAAALEAAHSMGVLHRDVKPQNVLLDSDGRARLADFGSARVTSMETVTRTGGLVGTIAYTAPEILAGERGDARCDLYSLGMTLYFGLTGQLPHQPSVHLPPTPSPVGHRPRAARPDVPAWLDDLTAMMTREDPGLRIPTAGLLMEALDVRDDGAVPLISPTAARPECVICGSPDPLGTGLCSACLGSETAGSSHERLLFLERGGDRNHRAEIEDRVREMVADSRPDADIAAAVRGELPLIRVPSAVVERVARHLRETGLPVRVAHPVRVGARLTPALGGALGVAIAIGMAAGLVAAKPMLLLTPVFAAVVIWSAVRRQAPSLLTLEAPVSMPAGMEDDAREALTSMPEGAARRLLADFVRMARELHASEAGSGLDTALTELVRGASQLATDLGGLDRSLAILEAQPDENPASPDWLETHARVSRARDRLVQRLLDAMAALARARAAGSASPADEEKRLVQLARDIEQDSELQAEAHRELDALLA